MLAVILLNVLVNGWSGLSWHFIWAAREKDMFDVEPRWRFADDRRAHQRASS